MTTQALPNVDQLADAYDVLGELTGRDDARMYLAKRREDGLDVLIVVATAPPGDEGNALSHLAADANLLASQRHRSVLPVVDGRWIGDAFALVLQRTNAPTLAELLNRRDEEFAYARIAEILSEVNGVLEWARNRKVVHRAIRPETLHVEPGTDRIHIAFTVAPLPVSGVPGVEEDATTIASLARAMFTRSPAAPERETQPLSELRPGLPTALLEETEQLLHPAPSSEPRDVSQYIARIAMADALKAAQDHLEETRNLIAKQEAEHRAQLEKERTDHDAQIANERKQHEEQIANEGKQHEREMETARKEHERQVAEQAKLFTRERETHGRDFTEQQRQFEQKVAQQQKDFERQVAERQRQFDRQVADQHKQFEKQVADQQKQFEKQVADQQKQFQRERDQFERELAKERQALARERDLLQKERAAHERDCAALARERSEHARERATLLEERAAHDEITREERDRMSTEAAALAMQADMYAHTAELPSRTVAEKAIPDVEVELPRHTEETPVPEARASRAFASPESPVAKHIEPPPSPKLKPIEIREYKPSRLSTAWSRSSAWVATAWSRRPEWRRSWNVPAAAIALVLLIGIVAIAVAGRGSQHAPRSASVVTPRARILDSAGGNVYESVVPLPKVETDTGVLSAMATDWTPPPRRRTARMETPPQERTDNGDVLASPSPRRTDTTFAPGFGVGSATGGIVPRPTPPDSLRRDTLRSPLLPVPLSPITHRDSLNKKIDSILRRDSIPRRP